MGKLFKKISQTVSKVAQGATKTLQKANSLGNAAHESYSLYGKFKERDQRGQSMFKGCNPPRPTTYFLHDGVLDGPGKPGNCGEKKDHSRTYCCKQCYEQYFK